MGVVVREISKRATSTRTARPELVEGLSVLSVAKVKKAKQPFDKLRASGVFCSLLVCTLTLTPTAHADTLIDNVNGITLDQSGKVQRFMGILIGNDGKIIRILTGKEPPPPPRKKKDRSPYPPQPDFRLDGKGRTLIPGFIDGHGHVMGLGWQALTLDLSDTRSLAEAKAKIADYAAANPGQKWITGRGWNQEVWGLGRFPNAADLDAILPDQPVWLERVDGHAGWANSAAMRAAGVTAKTLSPAGGRIEMEAGKPNGIFVDAAADLIQRAVPKPLSKERDLAFVKAQESLLSFGITSIADMGSSSEDWNTFRRAGDRSALRIRIFSYAAGLEPMLSVAGGEPTPWLYDSKLRMVGVKLYTDGALGSRGAFLKTPYADKPSERGLSFITDTALRNQMTRAAMDGFQLAVHAIGDAGNAQVLDAIDELALTFTGDRRWRVEHAQILAPSDIPRFAKNEIIASMQPVHQTSDRTMAEARLGPSRLAGAYAWRSILNVGGKLAFGSDLPVENPNVFAGIAAALTREDAKGEPFGGWQPQEKISREEALAGFTTGAAYASFAENKVGRIAPGLYGDFVFLDRDPLLATPAELRATKVMETWVGGQKVFTAK
jgi:predicted amidohydrolase YtcJ